jgi:hypothetical protein
MSVTFSDQKFNGHNYIKTVQMYQYPVIGRVNVTIVEQTKIKLLICEDIVFKMAVTKFGNGKSELRKFRVSKT